jgi:hypothetical protein
MLILQMPPIKRALTVCIDYLTSIGLHMHSCTLGIIHEGQGCEHIQSSMHRRSIHSTSVLLVFESHWHRNLCIRNTI